MSIEAKALLLKDMEQRLSTEITAADMGKVLSALADQLAGYQLMQTDPGVLDKDDLLDAYTAAMQIQGRSPKTIERYRYAILRMMKVVKVRTRSITVYHLRQYLAEEKARGISDRTLEGTRQVFSAYFNWLQREGLIDTNPTANLGAIKYQKKIKVTYTDIDIERLKYNCASIRDRAIVCFLRSTGCHRAGQGQQGAHRVPRCGDGHAGERIPRPAHGRAARAVHRQGHGAPETGRCAIHALPSGGARERQPRAPA